MSEKYRINLDPIMDRIKLGEVITMATSGGNHREFGPKEIGLHGTLITSDRLDCWPQTLLEEIEEEIEEEIDPRYILVDAPVEVSDDKERWYKAHFVRRSETGLYHVFKDGKSKFSCCVTETSNFYHWRIPESMDPEEWKAKWHRPPTE